MDEGWVAHAIAEPQAAPSKQVRALGGQNMGSGRWWRGGDPISRSAERLHCGQNKTWRRRWLESWMRSRGGILHHRTSSPSSAFNHRSGDEPGGTPSRPSRVYGHEAQVTCVRGPGKL